MGRACRGCPRVGTGLQPRESIKVQMVGIRVSLGAHPHVLIPGSLFIMGPSDGGTARRMLVEVVAVLGPVVKVFPVSVCHP